MEALKVQNQIRQNAEEISGFFSDLAKWEKDIKLKDKKIQEKKNHATPVRGAGAIKISSTATTTTSPNSNISKLNSAAQHTYDIGYERWNKLDENKLLENIDNPINLTPAHLVPNAPEIPQTAIPRPRGVAQNQDIEQYERERGNTEFNAGNFTAAIKCYTKCLGLKAQNYIAFSNRAMTYLKLQDYSRAEMDCTSALRIEPNHVKSLLRRATARNALGKHRSAILDLKTAFAIDPTNKQVLQELKKSNDLLKTAVSRAPMVAISTVWADDTLSPDSTNEKLGDSPLIDIVAGPDLPLPGQYVSVSQLAQIETPTSQGDSQIIQEPKVANQNQDERSPPMSPISTLKLTSSVEKKEKQKQTAKSATSKKSKKKEVSSSSEPTSVCYGIERSLQLYRGNIKQLTEYLASLSPDKIFKGSNSTNGGMLESSVIADLLLSVTLCYGTVLSDWDRVFYWYESCSTTISSKEFKFILMLLSNDQKDEMRRCLESSRGVSGEDERLDSILRTYELIQ